VSPPELRKNLTPPTYLLSPFSPVVARPIREQKFVEDVKRGKGDE
jgi:hypothetical protein